MILIIYRRMYKVNLNEYEIIAQRHDSRDFDFLDSFPYDTWPGSFSVLFRCEVKYSCKKLLIKLLIIMQ